MGFGSLGMRAWIWYGFAIAVLVAVAGLQGLQCAYGFPPYRLTDAETADPGTLEVRLGLLRTEHERHDTAYSSPLLRMNLGLPQNLELISEFDYRPDEGRVTDAALGLKWIPFRRALSVGMETLALLPVSSPNHKGAGVDALLLATLRMNALHLHVDALHLHVNAGGFYDGRPAVAESGWKSGAIMEVQLGALRPGLEVFAKQVGSQPVQIQVGPGLIFDAGRFDIRAGLHVGLTAEAADLTPSFWITRKFPLW